MSERPTNTGRRSRGSKPPATAKTTAASTKGVDRQGRPAPRRAVDRNGRPRPETPKTWTPVGPTVTVDGRSAGNDLAHFLADHFPGLGSINAARRALDEGLCRVDGAVETFRSRKMRRGEIVELIVRQRSGPINFDRKRLLHDADGLIAYDKPAGLAVTPTDSGRGTCLEAMLSEALGPVRAAHRLDAETSGIVLLARDDATLAWLETAFREHRVRKTYRAVVRDVPALLRGVRDTYLVLQSKQQGQERWGTGRGQGAMQAVTRWRVSEAIGRVAAQVVVDPETGRTHQIRVHLAELGHPLLGDRTYGDRRDPIPVTRHLLHAARVVVPLPTGGELTLSATIPADMRAAVMALRKL